jgi:hypothetical protein
MRAFRVNPGIKSGGNNPGDCRTRRRPSIPRNASKKFQTIPPGLPKSSENDQSFSDSIQKHREETRTYQKLATERFKRSFVTRRAVQSPITNIQASAFIGTQGSAGSHRPARSGAGPRAVDKGVLHCNVWNVTGTRAACQEICSSAMSARLSRQLGSPQGWRRARLIGIRSSPRPGKAAASSADKKYSELPAFRKAVPDNYQFAILRKGSCSRPNIQALGLSHV